MYRRTDKKLPEYKVIINDKEDVKIHLDKLNESGCLTNIQNALDNYITTEDYIDFVFEKDITTKYKPKQKGLRELEFEYVNEPLEVFEEEEQMEIIPKKRVKKLKGKRINHTLVLNDEEPIEIVNEPQKNIILEEIIFPEEQIDIIPIKKRKTRKQREKKLRVNPPGKKATRRKVLKDIQIEGDLEIIN